MSPVQYKKVKVDTVNIAYREAGNPSNPAILLLHGHASGSHVFRNLIPLISDQFYVVAPDYPAFGNSDFPPASEYDYTFVNLANTIDKFTEIIGLKKFIPYLFDFGAPIGLYIASKHPERIAGIFTQSGNAYEEGLAPAFEGIKKYWADPSPANAEPLKGIFSVEGLHWAYLQGVDPATMTPDSANLDALYMSRPGAVDVQIQLLKDYENNVKAYPAWQAYLREHKPKVVAIWGKDDPFFAPPGAKAYAKDLPDADITIIDGGHFLNDSNPEAIARGIKKFL